MNTYQGKTEIFHEQLNHRILLPFNTIWHDCISYLSNDSTMHSRVSRYHPSQFQKGINSRRQTIYNIWYSVVKTLMVIRLSWDKAWCNFGWPHWMLKFKNTFPPNEHNAYQSFRVRWRRLSNLKPRFQKGIIKRVNRKESTLAIRIIHNGFLDSVTWNSTPNLSVISCIKNR